MIGVLNVSDQEASISIVFSYKHDVSVSGGKNVGNVPCALRLMSRFC